MNVVTPRAHFDAARWIFSTTQSTLAFRRDKQKRKKKRSGYTRKSSFWKKNISLGVCFKYSQRAVFPFRKKTPETRVIFNVGWFEILSLNERSMQKRDPILSKTNRRKKELQPPICPLKDGTLLQIKIHWINERSMQKRPHPVKNKQKEERTSTPHLPPQGRDPFANQDSLRTNEPSMQKGPHPVKNKKKEERTSTPLLPPQGQDPLANQDSLLPYEFSTKEPRTPN